MVEVCHEGIGKAELIRREHELIGPSLVLLQESVGTHSRLRSTGGADTYAADTTTCLLGLIDQLAGFARHEHLLG